MPTAISTTFPDAIVTTLNDMATMPSTTNDQVVLGIVQNVLSRQDPSLATSLTPTLPDALGEMPVIKEP